jgi:uncharacterized protein YdaU (DUF1376 family)
MDESYHMHYYKFNIGDYASHTQHLDPIEDIAYRRMIDWLYLNEIPLPSDLDEIARLIRMRTHCDCIANVLREFFELHSDGYRQPRIERELQTYAEKSEKARKSAKARWDQEPSKQAGLADANALRNECERNANHKPLTINQEPITNKEKITSSPSVSDPIPYMKIVDSYHKHLPDLPSCKVVSAKRKTAMRQRHLGIMEKDIDNWAGYFKMVGRSKFLMGQLPGKDWRASFDFLITEKAAIGVLEGKYK